MSRAGSYGIKRVDAFQEHMNELFLKNKTGGDEINYSQPAPDIYLKAASELGVDPSECVAVEDSFNGIRSCYAAGYKPVMVPDRIQPDEEMEKLCWKIGKPISVLRKFL